MCKLTNRFYSFSEQYFLSQEDRKMFVKTDENYIEISDFGKINLAVTLDCGQAFRWRQNSDSSWTGVVRGVETTVAQTDNGLRFYGISEKQFLDVITYVEEFKKPYIITESIWGAPDADSRKPMP